jgi:chemotaxis methyl-accepting protein methylase
MIRSIAPTTGRYRHVVFADAIDAGQPINLAPADNAALDADFEPVAGEFLEWLFDRGGLDVRHYRAETLSRRLGACLRKLRASSLAGARAAIERDPALVHDALSAMLIGVTHFFRDPLVFNELAVSILPSLLSRKSNIRIWSAGCSDGAELYSIAMLLAEIGAAHRAELLGTDVRMAAVRTAQVGIYEQVALSEMSADRLVQHFDPFVPPESSALRGPCWRVKESLRSMARWRSADLLRTLEPGPWDLILCRNTAMYFRSESAAKVVGQLHSSLVRGGYLVLGHAERPIGGFGSHAPGAGCFLKAG